MKTHLALLAATGLMAACTQTAPVDSSAAPAAPRVATAAATPSSSTSSTVVATAACRERSRA